MIGKCHRNNKAGRGKEVPGWRWVWHYEITATRLTAWESPRRRGPLGKDLKGRRQRRGRPHEKRTARRLQERKPEDAEATDRSQQVRSDLHFQALSLTHKAKDAGSPPGNYRI